MNLEELRESAKQAFEQFDGSQKDLGELIGVDRAAISRAIRKEGLAHASVQARIISHVEDVPVQRRSTYRGRAVEHEWVRVPPSRFQFSGRILDFLKEISGFLTTEKDRRR